MDKYNKKRTVKVRLLKQNFLPPHVNIQKNTDTDHIGSQRANTIAHKWQRNAGNRHDASRHPYINQHVKGQHGGNAGSQQSSKIIFGQASYLYSTVQQEKI